MFKIAIRDPDRFFRLNAVPFLRRLTTLRLTSVPGLSRDQWVAFSDTFKAPGGAYMSTRRGRFADIDAMIPRFLSRDRPNTILDVGVSCGVTSLELYDRLAVSGLAFKLYVSDRNAELYATGDRICRVYDTRGGFVEGYLFFFLGRTSTSWTGLIAKGLGWLLRSRPRTSQGTTISMFHRDLRDRITRGEIHKLDYDLFRAGTKERFSFVRCMNLLNRTYFHDDKLRSGLIRLAESLEFEGALQIGQTDMSSGLNHVSFYRKDAGGGLELLETVNGGAGLNDVMPSRGPLAAAPRSKRGGSQR